MKPARASAPGSRYASTTGSHSRRRCTSATDSRPTRVDAEVASRIGRNTSVGSGAPCCARYMKMVTGSSVSDDALSTRNRICALVARVGSGLSVCSSRIAFRPIGVAALSRPNALAAKFMVISPSAGWPAGTPGMSLRNSGPSNLASHATSPAASAMRRKPSHRVSVPNSSTMTSTARRAMANRLSTMAANTAASPPISQRPRAASAATTKNPSHRPLSMRSPLRLRADHRRGAGKSQARGATSGLQRASVDASGVTRLVQRAFRTTRLLGALLALGLA